MIDLPLPEHIFLFGHRQQHGKDTCSDLLKNICEDNEISYSYSFFARLLKKQVAERYNLDFEKMEEDAYKNWCPPWVTPKEDGSRRTVRDILIEEGNKGRSIWQNTWAAAAYRDLFEAGSTIGIISDYRFPNEYECFKDVLKQYSFGKKHVIFNTPKVHRVLIHRPAGKFKNDGADGELPDLEEPEMWDYVIMNDIEGNGWKEHLKEQILEMLNEVKILGA